MSTNHQVKKNIIDKFEKKLSLNVLALFMHIIKYNNIF